jgi:WD40 repeat protein
MEFSFDAYVTAALFDRAGKVLFALGDGTVRLEDGTSLQAHPDGAVQCACPHPSGEGIVTGGDDGRVVWTRASGSEPIGEIPRDTRGGRWIDCVASSAESGLIAFAAGKQMQVKDAKDPAFARAFAHEHSLSDLAFDPKGRRIAAATYGGVGLWYARIAEQKPQMLAWAGSHVGVVWSPDGKFIVSAMQENQLHGWRLSDAKNMQMGGYPSKVKSMAFAGGGLILATAGAQGAVVWPFMGANGPLGKQASEVAYDEGLTTRVAAAGGGSTLLAVGRDDGRVVVLNLKETRNHKVRDTADGSPITALALSTDGRRLAWGCEDGAAGVAELPPL